MLQYHKPIQHNMIDFILIACYAFYLHFCASLRKILFDTSSPARNG